MRVIDHRQRQLHQKKNTHKSKPLIIGACVLLIGGVILYILNSEQTKANQPVNNKVESKSISSIANTEPKTGKLKNFTGSQFKDLYNGFAYPNTKRISEDTPITGNSLADDRIRRVAVSRGYLVRSAPVSNTFQDVGKGYLLQQRAAQPWTELKANAKQDGINLGLTAAYRSAEDQKQLFLQQLSRTGIIPESIADGSSDPQLSQILRSTAIPAYSRHHTGYTVDISCENDPKTAFEYTVCFKWLNANNYEKAKTYGWLPSYPEGAGMQGPDPETWEYVWVGTDAVRL